MAGRCWESWDGDHKLPMIKSFSFGRNNKTIHATFQSRPPYNFIFISPKIHGKGKWRKRLWIKFLLSFVTLNRSVKWAIAGLFYCLFLVFSSKYFNFYNICEKISIQYPVPRFKPTTSWTWVTLSEPLNQDSHPTVVKPFC